MGNERAATDNTHPPSGSGGGACLPGAEGAL